MRLDMRGDFEFGRQFIPHMKEIVAGNLVQEAPEEEDMRHNTDLIVLKLEAVRVACRVRRNQYLNAYGDEFTVRARRPSGDSEMAKVLAGWGDYMIYGFAPPDDCGPRMAQWFLGDLSVFRLWFHRETVTSDANQLPGFGKDNTDGSSSFRAFRLDELPAEFVIARSQSVPVAF
jgi:hypothetical protein